MYSQALRLLIICIITPLLSHASGAPSSPDSLAKIKMLYSSLDRTSMSDTFAFYKLYPQSTYGKRALERAFALINKHRDISVVPKHDLSIPEFDVQGLISVVNKLPFAAPVQLSDDQLSTIEKMCNHLANRRLKGHNANTIEDVRNLPCEEVDLARALLLYQFQESEDPARDIARYEANLDMMALQVLARLPRGASNLEKIRAINAFIFHEMRFRFPPQSLSTKEIDTYTFLPSVLDSRLGVCLGVSILYLSLAQRLDLPLEIITPPGHIYLSYIDVDGRRLNIETTARGIDVPEEHYFGINTASLQTRTMKETIGLSFQNQASVVWNRGNHEEAAKLYKEALYYLPDDKLVHLFLGINQLALGELEEGKAHLIASRSRPDPTILHQDTLAEDYLKGRVTPAGLCSIFKHVDETRESILEKQQQLLATLGECPKFRDGWFALAITWLQLSRHREALEALKTCHALDQNDPTVEYYLAALNLKRYQYKSASEHLNRARTIIGELEPQKKILFPLVFELKLYYDDASNFINDDKKSF